MKALLLFWISVVLVFGLNDIRASIDKATATACARMDR